MENIVVIFEGADSGTALKKELVNRGYKVVSVCVEDEEGALSVLAKHNGAVKIVVIDLDTLRIYSLEFLKKMRLRGYKYPVIVLAGSEKKFHSFGELDVYDIVEKPFKTSCLLDMIEDCQRVYGDLRREIGSTVKMLRELIKT